MSTTDHVADLLEDLDPGSVVLRYVVIAEILTASGERCIVTDTHEGATRWDNYGLVTEALEEQRAAHYRAGNGD